MRFGRGGFKNLHRNIRRQIHAARIGSQGLSPIPRLAIGSYRRSDWLNRLNWTRTIVDRSRRTGCTLPLCALRKEERCLNPLSHRRGVTSEPGTRVERPRPAFQTGALTQRPLWRTWWRKESNPLTKGKAALTAPPSQPRRLRP
jgi:hypothetical protein